MKNGVSFLWLNIVSNHLLHTGRYKITVDPPPYLLPFTLHTVYKRIIIFCGVYETFAVFHGSSLFCNFFLSFMTLLYSGLAVIVHGFIVVKYHVYTRGLHGLKQIYAANVWKYGSSARLLGSPTKHHQIYWENCQFSRKTTHNADIRKLTLPPPMPNQRPWKPPHHSPVEINITCNY